MPVSDNPQTIQVRLYTGGGTMHLEPAASGADSVVGPSVAVQRTYVPRAPAARYN